MSFPVGAAVRVVTLGRTGEVVEAGRGGRYRVRVGGVVLSCRQDDLRADETAGRPKRGGAARTFHPDDARREPAGPDRQSASIDLHGCTVEEALTALASRVDTALREGSRHLDIIHGRGSGRIKNAVHRFLREVSAVRGFEIQAGNPGVTRVFF